MNVISVLGFYLIILNLLGFMAMYLDKQKARKRAFRIPESTLFMIAIIGGSPGVLIGMHLFHHKTRHPIFVFGIPAILIIQLLLLVILYLSPVRIIFL